MTEQRKTTFDAIGIGAMVGFTLLMAINQVSIKFVNDGLQPVFQAGLRSFFAAILITGFVLITGRRFNLRRAFILPGVFIGFLFAIEFLFLYISLDLTTVSHVNTAQHAHVGQVDPHVGIEHRLERLLHGVAQAHHSADPHSSRCRRS